MFEQTMLNQGESPMRHAPSVKLPNGDSCIPQHYLLYQHNFESVHNIVLAIKYDDRYPVFVCQEGDNIIIQVGIIGVDNYAVAENKNHQKIVYGRKWRIEPELPTSEVIQTVFLAIKKAREHEIRELLCYRKHSKKLGKTIVTTPFNNHQDLPLIARNAALFVPTKAQKNTTLFNSTQVIQHYLEHFTYNSAAFKLTSIEQRANKKWLIDINIVPDKNTQLPELMDSNISIMLESLCLNRLSYALMHELIELSDRHVDEHFSYQNVNRFSWENDISAIAELSYVLRNKLVVPYSLDFDFEFSQENYATDKSRVPTLIDSPLSDRIRKILSQYKQLQGILPL